jgi:hypothetical protein
MGRDRVYVRTDAINGHAQVLGSHPEDGLTVYRFCTVAAMSGTSHVPHPPLSHAKRYTAGRLCSASLAWLTLLSQSLGKLNDKENIRLPHYAG